jgi:hydroxymethylpyrimidine pyrophosphatase-like HAD family hydrolase
MIGADKLYTVGDNENDIAMLKLADYSAVIETAPPHVLDSADMIVKTPDRGGIVEFIDLLLGKEE